VGDEEEVREGRQRLQAERAQSRREPLALGDRLGDVGRPCLETRERERRRDRRHRSGLLALVQLGGELGGGDSVADARRRETERLRERPDDDHAVADQRNRRLPAVLEVRLVDDERAGSRNVDHRA
jgi:hypothetical protein